MTFAIRIIRSALGTRSETARLTPNSSSPVTRSEMMALFGDILDTRGH
ncbi:hypothetical protein [Loktanella sp. M215]|nr:hypothetical protein [Loktanella sp. M215]MCF7701268.1 hypothetical protein [Loktanella sp. M215]